VQTDRQAQRTCELTAFGEERLENGGAVGGEDAGGDFYLMVEKRVGEDFETGAKSAALGIVSAIDHAQNAGLDDGAGAHAAGLDGDVKSGAGEAIVAEKAGGFAKGDDFGMGGGVIVANGTVVRTRQNLAITDEHSADGDFAGLGSGASFCKGFLHELDISFHLPREDNMREEQKRIQTQRYRVRREE